MARYVTPQAPSSRLHLSAGIGAWCVVRGAVLSSAPVAHALSTEEGHHGAIEAFSLSRHSVFASRSTLSLTLDARRSYTYFSISWHSRLKTFSVASAPPRKEAGGGSGVVSSSCREPGKTRATVSTASAT